MNAKEMLSFSHCHYFYVDPYFVVSKIAILPKAVTQPSTYCKMEHNNNTNNKQQHEKQYKFTMEILDARLAVATTRTTKKKSKQKHF